MRPAARGVSLKELTGNMQLKPRVLLVEHRSDLAAMYQLAFEDRKSTRLNSSHLVISYAVFCLKKKKQPDQRLQGHEEPAPGRGDGERHGLRVLERDPLRHDLAAHHVQDRADQEGDAQGAHRGE